MANYVGTNVRVFMKNGDSVDGTILFVDNVILKLGQVTITQRGISSKREQLIVKASDIKDLSVLVQETPKQEEIPKNGTSPKLTSQDDDLLTPDTFIKKEPAPPNNVSAPRPAATPDSSQYKDPAIISMSSVPLPPPQMPPAPTFPHDSRPIPMQPIYPHPSYLAPPGAHPPGVFPYPPSHPSMYPRMPPQPQQPLPQQPAIPQPTTITPTVNGQPAPQPQGEDADNEDSNGSPSKNGRRNKKNGSVSPRRSNLRKMDQAAFSKPVDQQTFTEDFDFVGNNARFNKQQVFAQMLEEANMSSAPQNRTPVAKEDIPSPQFKSDSNVSVPAVTADKMKELTALLEAEGPNAYQVIENVARSLAQLSFRYIKGKENPKVAILVGVGTKGSCGIATARHLANHNIGVFICRSRAYQLPEQHLFQRNLYRGTSGKEAHVGSLPVEPVDLIIDCLIGTGLRGAPTGPTLTLIQWANANGAPILALDVPSGVNASTGKAEGEFIHAHTTMTVALPKTGLTKEKAGQLYLADVGIPRSIFSKLGVNYTSPFSEFFVIKLNFV